MLCYGGAYRVIHLSRGSFLLFGVSRSVLTLPILKTPCSWRGGAGTRSSNTILPGILEGRDFLSLGFRGKDWTHGGSAGKESACNIREPGSIPGLGRSPRRRDGLPSPVFWPGEFHRQRSLVGYSPWGRKELDKTEQLSLFTLMPMIFL